MSLPINEWVASERPRELLLEKGPANLSTSKLLAILLRIGSKEGSAEDLALRLINQFKSIRGIDEANIEELYRFGGIGPAKAAQLKAAFEIGKRLYSEECRKADIISSPVDAITYITNSLGVYLASENREQLHLLFLDTKDRVMGKKMLTLGTKDCAVIDPKEILREALLCEASSLIMVHNHPSGETYPSTEDINVTERIKCALALLQIELSDHIIIGKRPFDYFSFKEGNLL